LIKIYVARHGETTWNVEGRIQGRSDPGLSPKGYAQSLALLEQLKNRPLSAIYTSTLQRSVLTAQPIAKYLNLPMQKQTELDEIAFGMMEGRQFSNMDEEVRVEWERFKENRLTYHIPGAENYADVAIRLRPFMERILQIHKGQEILIVGHRGANRMLIGMLLEYPLEKCLKIEQTNECLYLLQRNGEYKVFCYLNGEVKEGLLFEGQVVII
jgi:broad specificity phosphatase PhoE